MKKVLIAYYSRRGENYVSGDIRDLKKGNVECLVEMISKELPEADVFQIETEKAYSSSYMTCIDEAKVELQQQARPALKVDCLPDAYDTIILGYPNWWGHVPMAVLTWLEAHDFSGKTIIPFCSHEGSGMGNTESDIRKACPNVVLSKGTAIHGTTASKATTQACQIAKMAK